MLSSIETQPVADRLAESLRSDDALHAFRLMTELQRNGALASRSCSVPGKESRTVRVGIWQREREDHDGAFVRAETGDPWHLWANVNEIPPKTAAKRVLLIGESVARGFFYGDCATPAKVLEQFLRTGNTDAEVIDLARTDLQPAALTELAQSAVALRPDAMVIFAGNNWHPISSLNRSDFRHLAGLVKALRPWSEVTEYLESRLAERTRSVLRTLGGISHDHGIATVFVIPEFNLTDWSAAAAPPPLLNDDELRQWLETREQAEQALSAGAQDELERLARRMLELDGGTAPAGYQFLVAARRIGGSPAAEIRPLLEAARDATISQTKYQPPRCFGVVHDVLRTEASRYGISIVDLPQVFERHLGGELPGKRLFHDYCHLTLEGMQVAMGAVAHALFPSADGRRTEQPPREQQSPVSKAGQAEAHFLAAIHNANWGNRIDVVEYHLRCALAQYPEIVTLMRNYVEFQGRSVPASVCGAFEQVARSNGMATAALLFRSPRLEKSINFTLLETMLQILCSIDAEAARSLLELLKAEHAIGRREVNLLRKFYWGKPWQETWDQDRCVYFRAAEATSSFVFICDTPAVANLHVTARVAGKPIRGPIQVRVNGTPVHSFPAENTWRPEMTTIAPSAMREGLNELEVRWPVSSWARPGRTSRIAHVLEEGRIPEAGPVFGELFTLTIHAPTRPQ